MKYQLMLTGCEIDTNNDISHELGIIYEFDTIEETRSKLQSFNQNVDFFIRDTETRQSCEDTWVKGTLYRFWVFTQY